MSEALAYPACCSDCPCPGSAVVAPPSDACDCSFIVKENVEDARAFNPATMSLPAILHTQGAETPGDSFGKTFWWNAASFAVDDGTPFTVVIRPVTISEFESGRWEQTSLG